MVTLIAFPALFAGSFLIPRALEESLANPPQNQPQVLSETAIEPRGEALVAKTFIPQLSTALNDSKVSAKSFLVFDLDSGTEIFSRQAEEQLPIASLTKLMTGLVVYRHAKLDENTTILDTDRLSVSPSLGLIAGDSVKLQDLFNAMLVGSDNDAALALANYIQRKAGRDFVVLMNETAQQLNMTDSRFSNPLGFDSSYNFSSARDLKKLVEETQRYTAFTSLSRTTQYSMKGTLGYTYRTKTTNKLIARDKQVFAVKTGFTENAGGSMITKIESDGHRIILIVIGSENRELDTTILKRESLAKIVWK